jgi:hypothetical protein
MGMDEARLSPRQLIYLSARRAVILNAVRDLPDLDVFTRSSLL